MGAKREFDIISSIGGDGTAIKKIGTIAKTMYKRKRPETKPKIAPKVEFSVFSIGSFMAKSTALRTIIQINLTARKIIRKAITFMAKLVTV